MYSNAQHATQAPEKTYELWDFNLFQNTKSMACALYRPANASRSLGATHYFSGYVFRGDTRPPEVVFHEGFQLVDQTPVVSEAEVRVLAGAEGGITGNQGVSTTVCASVAGYYCNRQPNFVVGRGGRRIRTLGYQKGYVYLIDALHLAGFAMPSPREDEFTSAHPVLREVYEVNFMHSIIGEDIVGMVAPGGWHPQGAHWSISGIDTLVLSPNPLYMKGEAGVKEVVKTFNALV